MSLPISGPPIRRITSLWRLSPGPRRKRGARSTNTLGANQTKPLALLVDLVLVADAAERERGGDYRLKGGFGDGDADRGSGLVVRYG